MKPKNARVGRQLAKFAPIIGGLDEKGVEHKLAPELKDGILRQHLFWVKNRDEDEMSGEFMLGHVIQSKIIDDAYDIVYLGLNKHSVEPKSGQVLSKEHKETLTKVRKYKERQVAEIVEGNRLNDERQGLYSDTAETADIPDDAE